MRDETAKDNRQTAALISHDLTRNNELAFSSTKNLYRFQIVKFFFLDFSFGKIDMNDTLRKSDVKSRRQDQTIRHSSEAPAKRLQHLNATYPNIVSPVFAVPAKRSQHLNATDRNIVGRNMLHAFGYPVASCCELKIYG